MKKLLVGLFAVSVIMACNNQHDLAMKSADKNFILKVANDYYAKGKYAKAIELYDRLPSLVAGTDDAADVVFNSAYSNYHMKEYRLAGHQFKKFSVTFPQDPRVEEAAYMSVLCYYKGSLDYNLDQANTKSAIEELQNFLNTYPDSERAKNISTLIDELNYKLEYKAYRNAKQYFDMAQYKAAIVSLNNVKNDFPGTKLSPKIEEYLLKSYYELGVNSRYDLKSERLKKAKEFAEQVSRSKDADNAKLAESLLSKIKKEQELFAIEEVKYKKELEKFEARKKREQESNRTHNELVEQTMLEKRARQTQRDSATNQTAKPSFEIPIKN